MQITREQVDHIARLARLDLADNERESLRGQLQRILGAVEKLDACKLEAGDTPELPQAGPLRDDVIVAGLSREAALANAPASSASGFAVPRVLDGADAP